MSRSAARAALTIAGSDSGGGAGIQADVRTFARYGLLGCTVITAVTAQNTTGLSLVQPMSAELVTAQLDAVLSDLPIRAMKTGMLANGAVAEAVADRLAALDSPPPLVLDPVCVSSTGTTLLDDAALSLLRARLLPLATVVTPNLPEAAALLGVPSLSSPADAAAALVDLAGGSCAALVTGGHGDDPDRCADVLCLPDGRTLHFESARVDTTSTHGTGCVLSAALAANLAHGLPLADAVRDARSHVIAALRTAEPMGRGPGPVNTAAQSVRRERT